MNDFRLIAIHTRNRPSENDYLKVLNENKFYTLYNDFSFTKKKNQIVARYNSSLIKNDLYNFESKKGKKINVNISAIVGKNGTGKSTLLELIYLAIFNIGAKLKILNYYEKDTSKKPEFDKDCNEKKHFKPIQPKYKKLNIDLFFLKEEKLFMLSFRNNNIFLKSQKLGNEMVFDITLNDTEQEFKNIEVLSSLFYSIVINYSIYGLNSKHVGKWIKPLFHKNDAYKTPIVINPMRTEGNFDINKEMEFATYRLVNNLLIEKYLDKSKEIYITDNQTVKSIKFTLNKDKVEKYKIEHIGSSSRGEIKSFFIRNEFIKTFLPEKEEIFFNENSPFIEVISNYLVQKIEKISTTYTEYAEGFNYRTNNLSSNEQTRLFFNKLKEDKSHITFKIRQVINFIENWSKSKNRKIKDKISNAKELKPSFELSLDELLEWMNFSEPSDIINHIPPSFFSIEIILSNKKNSSPSKFSELSSGEQQKIHSIQSVLYHINNLQSAHYSKYERITYEYVNIIFDEIELYFHPEYQRKFINELLNSLKRLDYGENNQSGGIKGINIIFSTHSPFILSDIPNSNILLMGEKNNEKIKTFGANIHEILGDSFFLENGYVGEFTKLKIEGLIEFYNSKNNTDRKEIFTEKEAMNFINLIDDHLISDRLKEMHQIYFDNENDDVDEKITTENYKEWLQSELDRLDYKEDYDKD